MRPADAVRRAVDEFGTYAEIVPGYQAELAVAQGRRTALWMCTALPVMHLLAPLMWWQGPWVNGKDPIAGYWTLTTNFDLLSLLASAVAMVLLVGFGWGSRFVRDSVGYARAVGVGVLVFLAVHGAAGVAVRGDQRAPVARGGHVAADPDRRTAEHPGLRLRRGDRVPVR